MRTSNYEMPVEYYAIKIPRRLEEIHIQLCPDACSLVTVHNYNRIRLNVIIARNLSIGMHSSEIGTKNTQSKDNYVLSIYLVCGIAFS